MDSIEQWRFVFLSSLSVFVGQWANNRTRSGQEKRRLNKPSLDSQFSSIIFIEKSSIVLLFLLFFFLFVEADRIFFSINAELLFGIVEFYRCESISTPRFVIDTNLTFKTLATTTSSLLNTGHTPIHPNNQTDFLFFHFSFYIQTNKVAPTVRINGISLERRATDQVDLFVSWENAANNSCPLFDPDRWFHSIFSCVRVDRSQRRKDERKGLDYSSRTPSVRGWFWFVKSRAQRRRSDE